MRGAAPACGCRYSMAYLLQYRRRDDGNRFEVEHLSHDCPSVCALEVEVLGDGRFGRVRGAKSHPYTLGVVCEKVARYAERIHHPGRLLHPLKRKGRKGSGEWQTISWTDALDEVAARMLEAEQRYGPDRLAILLRRNDGPCAARRHQPP